MLHSGRLLQIKYLDERTSSALGGLTSLFKNVRLGQNCQAVTNTPAYRLQTEKVFCTGLVGVIDNIAALF